MMMMMMTTTKKKRRRRRRRRRRRGTASQKMNKIKLWEKETTGAEREKNR